MVINQEQCRVVRNADVQDRIIQVAQIFRLKHNMRAISMPETFTMETTTRDVRPMSFVNDILPLWEIASAAGAIDFVVLDRITTVSATRVIIKFMW